MQDTIAHSLRKDPVSARYMRIKTICTVMHITQKYHNVADSRICMLYGDTMYCHTHHSSHTNEPTLILSHCNGSIYLLLKVHP